MFPACYFQNLSNGAVMKPLLLSSPAERARYIDWAERLAADARGRMQEFLDMCAAAVRNNGERDAYDQSTGYDW